MLALCQFLDTDCMNLTLLHRTISLSLALLLVAPSLGAACTIPFRMVGPLSIERSEIARPISRTTTNSAWGLDATWTGTTTELNQVIRTRARGTHTGVSFAKQRAIPLDAVAPDSNGWTWANDDNPATPPCTMVGQSEWQTPVIRVKEDRSTIRLFAAAQLTVGDRTGCVPWQSDPTRIGCPTLTRTLVQLAKPVGQRQIILETTAA